MKSTLIAVLLGLALAGSARATDVAVKLTGVHLCCRGCARGAETAAKVSGVTVAVDADEETVSITGPDQASVQKSVDGLIAGGFYGKTDDKSVVLKVATGAKGAKVASLEVAGVHLCCDKCVKALKTAVGTVPGVKETVAVKGAKTFTVTGEFSDGEVFAALEKAGLSGKVAKP